MQPLKNRYTILHLMGVTVVFALCFVSLLNESPWWRALLMTVTLCLVLNSLIGSAVRRGRDQAFSVGFAISSFFFLVSLYTLAGIETIPLLLTQHTYAYLVNYSTTPPSSEHFYIVATLIWGLACAYSGGLLGRRWYNQRTAQCLPDQVASMPDQVA